MITISLDELCLVTGNQGLAKLLLKFCVIMENIQPELYFPKQYN